MNSEKDIGIKTPVWTVYTIIFNCNNLRLCLISVFLTLAGTTAGTVF